MFDAKRALRIADMIADRLVTRWGYPADESDYGMAVLAGLIMASHGLESPTEDDVNRVVDEAIAVEQKRGA